MVQIKNTKDQLCFARSLAVCLAKLVKRTQDESKPQENPPQWLCSIENGILEEMWTAPYNYRRTKLDSLQYQEHYAKELHRIARVPERMCSIADFSRFQDKVLTPYGIQLLVMHRDIAGAIDYAGPI